MSYETSNREIEELIRRRLGDDEEATRILTLIRNLYQERKKREFDFSTISEVAEEINVRCLDLAKTESYATSLLMGQFGVFQVSFLRQPHFASDEIVASRPLKQHPLPTFMRNGSFGRWLAVSTAPILLEKVPDARTEHPELEQMFQQEVRLCLPLIRGGSPPGEGLVGCVCLGKRMTGQDYAPPDLEFLWILGRLVAVALHNAHLHHRAQIDSLTGVYSRGYFDVHLIEEFQRAMRSKKEDEEYPFSHPVSLVMLDIDHFKDFNTLYGHPVGDAVLQSTALLLKKSVRLLDTVTRYGGEEFAIILPDTTKEHAAALAERLRQRIEEHRIDVDENPALQVTASFGVATYPGDGTDLQSLVIQADQALYRAKDGGRNRVESSN